MKKKNIENPSYTVSCLIDKIYANCNLVQQKIDNSAYTEMSQELIAETIDSLDKIKKELDALVGK